MLLVSHEMSFVRNVATRVIFLDGGKILEDGTPREVFGNPKNDVSKSSLQRSTRDGRTGLFNLREKTKSAEGSVDFFQQDKRRERKQ